MENWEIEEVGPNVIYATKRDGQHAATVAIRYEERSFSIELRNSSYLKQREDGRIHKVYNEWIDSLESAIRREVASGL